MTNTTIPDDTGVSDSKAQEILEKFDRESVTRSPKDSWVRYVIAGIAILYSVFHLYITFNPLPEIVQRSIHVAVGAALIFLIYPPAKKSSRQKVVWYDWIWATLALSSAGYLIWQYQDIVTVRGGIPNQMDIVFAIITVVVVMEMARRITGWILPIFALVFLVLLIEYTFLESRSW